ncbi:MAG: hypothetical protein GPJ54_04725 [Candidatus Heimdallarchaeota archaeon]|nr:hypothetical protein [Candidatus Heimdallarchaeota archaeon]
MLPQLKNSQDNDKTDMPTSTNKSMSIMLLAASLLVLLSGILLFLLSEQTDTYFAWTINPPLTAAFLGAGYWASFLLEFLSSRERQWERARLAVPSVEVFTFLTLIVTLIHLDRFHTSDPNFITWSITWVWIVVYVSVPIVLGGLLVKQLLKTHIKLARVAPLSKAIRLILGLQGTIMLLTGSIMLIAPDEMIPIWPWTLSILTSRAIGAWGIGIGIIAVHAAWENDWWRLTPMMAGYTLYGFLQLINLVRYTDTFLWERPSALLYTFFIVSIFFLGSYGSWKIRRFSGSN